MCPFEKIMHINSITGSLIYTDRQKLPIRKLNPPVRRNPEQM